MISCFSAFIWDRRPPNWSTSPTTRWDLWVHHLPRQRYQGPARLRTTKISACGRSATGSCHSQGTTATLDSLACGSNCYECVGSCSQFAFSRRFVTLWSGLIHINLKAPTSVSQYALLVHNRCALWRRDFCSVRHSNAHIFIHACHRWRRNFTYCIWSMRKQNGQQSSSP